MNWNILINPDIEMYASAESYERAIMDRQRARVNKIRAEAFKRNWFK